ERECCGRGARATGQRLAAAALVDAHPDVADAVGDHRIERHDELDVRPVDRFGFKDGNVLQVCRLEFGDAREGDDDVRVADIDSEAGACDLEVLRAHERFAAVERPATEVDLEPGKVLLNVAYAAARANREGLALRQ